MAHSYTIDAINSKLSTCNKLRAISFLDKDDTKKYPVPRVLCQCICGKYRECNVPALIRGNPQSCGCSQRRSRTSHGLAKGHPLYDAWHNMKRRCFNPKTYAFHRYGGRYITICDEWIKDFSSFYNWAILNGWKKGLQIDRIDNNGNYCPENCRFVTSKQNGCNREHNIYIEHNGKKMMIKDWAKETGINWMTIYSRYRKGMPIETVLSTTKFYKKRVKK